MVAYQDLESLDVDHYDFINAPQYVDFADLAHNDDPNADLFFGELVSYVMMVMNNFLTNCGCTLSWNGIINYYKCNNLFFTSSRRNAS